MNKLETIVERYNQLEERLANPELIADQVQYQKVGKDYKDLKPLVEAYRQYAGLMGNIETARAMLADSDLEMKEMAQEELNALLPRQEEMEENLRILLVPKDPEDSKDVIFEIRSGTGGDEATLPASFRAFQRANLALTAANSRRVGLRPERSDVLRLAKQ